MSQEHLAETIGMSIDTVSSIERGKAFATLATLLALSEALDEKLGSFFGHLERDAEIVSLPIQELLASQPKAVVKAAEDQVRILVQIARGSKR